MEPKFKKSQAVIYVRGSQVELGIIKQVIPVEMQKSRKEDGPFGTPTGELYTGYKYFVYYHTGDTAALTNEGELHSIENDYAFRIIRIKAK